MGALDDPDDGVQRSALDAVARRRPNGATDAVIALLEQEKSWPIRVRAAETLGDVSAGSRNKRAFAALVAAAKNDPYALVREAAVKALWKVDAVGAKATLGKIAEHDSEPRVRAAAKKAH
jgi:HEAT repeat protein